MGKKQAQQVQESKEPEKAEAEEPPAVKELKALHENYEEINKRYQAELQDIQRKYMKEQEPLLAERTKVLTAKPEGAETDHGTPAVPGFWLKALLNHPAFEDQIEGYDRPVLEYVKDITKSYLDPTDFNRGFKLLFHFSENPYFTNESLWKEYHTEMKSSYETDVKEIKVCEIDWKPGKDVTVEIIQKKKPKGGGAKKKAPKATEEPRDSFFRGFFRHLKKGMPVPDDVNLEDARQLSGADSDEEDDDEMMELLLENDHEVGIAVRDQLIPFAINFLEGEEDDDDYDLGDDDDEDEESESESPKKKKNEKANKPSATPQVGNKEDCKQQ